MEVQIKKAKITATLLNQSTSISFKKAFEIKLLGWCIHKKLRYMIFFDEQENLVHRIPLIRSTEQSEKWEQITNGGDRQLFFYVIVRYYNNFSPSSSQFTKKDDADIFNTKINDLYKKALEVGQFYI